LPWLAALHVVAGEVVVLTAECERDMFAPAMVLSQGERRCHVGVGSHGGVKEARS
jgi:hypothetical protein